jgi:RNA polymerase sporulation-specific sigma factor
MKNFGVLEQLVNQARNGDVGAKERILDQFNPLLLKNIVKYFGKSQDFNDWLQEGRLVILQSIYNYNENLGVPFAAYVQKQVFYYYINERKKIREEAILDQPLFDGRSSLLELLQKDEPCLEKTFLLNQEVMSLYNAIDMLSIKQKEVLIEYYFNKKSLKSLAKDKNLCYQSLIKLKARALKKLRKEMEDNSKASVIGK